ncbi:hypothetical protein PRIPAC_84987 [Pristionchus pacificus]|uniref:Uncharacterized protein n=1 Tax=Pristionchus pacificus TaxID=54126 RepID=A0A2A6CIQ4_PRIPA|nr:hypothetical protein PRIPAC_84987 [Pristionchus pacificus]|eukprot:PDM77980.1 hypothetical protein PRIPAC_35169 [Pristionchus pacificus]
MITAEFYLQKNSRELSGCDRKEKSLQGSTRRVETEENVTSDLVPRTDFVRIIRASGERHERQISKRLEAFGDGERHMITVDRNGNVLQFRRPSPFFSLQSSPFRQPPFFQRGITRSRSSHGFSRRRPTISPLVTIRPRTTTVTHDGSMDTVLQPSENTLQPPTVTREGTVTNEFKRIPVRTPNSPTGRVQSLRIIHGGSMEREESRERVPIAHPMRERPLRISSSFEVLPRRENNRFRIGGPPFGEVTTPVPSTRVFIQTPRPFRLRPPPIRQRPQPPRRVEALSNDEEEFTPSGRSPVSPSVVAPFRSFRSRLPSTRFTLPPRSPIRTGPSPLHTSPLPSTTFSSTEPSTTHSTTPSTTSVTESRRTTQLTTPSSTTIEVTTEGTTFGTTATTSRPSPTHSKPSLPRTDKITVTEEFTSIGKTTTVPKSSTVHKTTTVPKSTTVTPAVTRVTPPTTTAKTRRTGTTRGFATVSPSISVKALPPSIPDDLSFNGIRGPLPPSPISSHSPHSTTGLPPSGRGVSSFPSSLSFDGPPGEIPPSDNVVHMLNDAHDFLEMARRLNITRKARIARRRKRMAEYGRPKW